MVIGKPLFLLVILKTELFAPKLVTANNHNPSSERSFGGEKEKVSICLFNLNSNVSCSLDFVCSIGVPLCLLIKSNYS